MKEITRKEEMERRGGTEGSWAPTKVFDGVKLPRSIGVIQYAQPVMVFDGSVNTR